MADATYSELLGTTLKLHYSAADASTIFQDAALTTLATADGDTVLGLAAVSDAGLNVALTGTSGFTYRPNYASSGYPALETTSTQRLFNTSTGLSSNVRWGVVCCYTRIGGTTSTVWGRGTLAPTTFARQLYTSDTAHYCQWGDNVSNYQNTITNAVGRPGKQVSVFVIDNDECLFAYRTSASGKSSPQIAPVLTNALGGAFYLNSADSGGSIYQGGNMAFHELILCEGSTLELGSLFMAATKMRTAWGVTEKSPVHQAASGGGSSASMYVSGM